MFRRFNKSVLRLALGGSLAVTPLAGSLPVFADDPPTSSAKVLVVLDEAEKPDQNQSGQHQANDEAPSLWLGVGLRDLSEDLSTYLDIDSGVMVSNIYPDSPAAKADLKKGDILLSVNDKKLNDAASLLSVLKANSSDKDKEKPAALKLKVLRQGKELSVELVPEKRPKNLKRAIVAKEIELKHAHGDGDKPHAEILNLIENQLKGFNRDGVQFFSFGAPSAMGGVFSGKIKGDIHANIAHDKDGKHVEISVHRKGDEAAKITVKEGDKTTEYTEDQLEKMPENVRDIVRGLLRGGARIQFNQGAFNIERRSAKSDDDKSSRESSKDEKAKDGQPSDLPNYRGQLRSRVGVFDQGGQFPRWIGSDDAEQYLKLAEEIRKKAQDWTRDAAAMPNDIKELREEVLSLRKELKEMRAQLGKANQGSKNEPDEGSKDK